MSECDCNNLLDPFGNKVTIPEKLCAVLSTLVDHDLGATIPDIIRKPALAVQTKDLDRLYYLRQYTFSASILVKAKKQYTHYEAFEFMINPESSVVGELMTGAKVLTAF